MLLKKVVHLISTPELFGQDDDFDGPDTVCGCLVSEALEPCFFWVEEFGCLSFFWELHGVLGAFFGTSWCFCGAFFGTSLGEFSWACGMLYEFLPGVKEFRICSHAGKGASLI